MENSVSVAILAGGQSSRMGQNKALLPVGGVPIVERVLGCVRDLSDDLMLIANEPADYAYLNLPIYPDVLPGRGPLGGLYTALIHAAGGHTLVVSCDQPFLNAGFLRYLLSLRAGYDVVVPLDRTGYPQSMYAVYGKACLMPIRARLDADRLKVIGFFPDVRVREVSGAEIDRFDPDRISFFNVNTPDDLAEARQLAENLLS
jgi:molybdopterin-guanine dinucleotide biosynthesis protein A